MDSVAIVETIEKALEIKNISKTQFYNDCKISRATFSQWRNGKNEPSNEALQRACAYLGLSFDFTESGIVTKTPAAQGDGRMMPEEFTARYWALSEAGRAALDQYAQFLQQQEAAAKAKADPAGKASGK